MYRLIKTTVAILLTVTGFIHWYLPIMHPAMIPGELTGGIILIPHDVLHVLFDLDGAGYLVLVALVAGWLPILSRQHKALYVVVAGYAALTIIAWILLSNPKERSGLDTIDKTIEILIVALAVWMMRRSSLTPNSTLYRINVGKKLHHQGINTSTCLNNAHILINRIQLIRRFIHEHDYSRGNQPR